MGSLPVYSQGGLSLPIRKFLWFVQRGRIILSSLKCGDVVGECGGKGMEL